MIYMLKDEVFVKTKSTPAFLVYKDRVTKYTPVKCAKGGLHCRHVGRQNKRNFSHIVCIKMAINSIGKILLFLSTNMAAMASHANGPYKGPLSRDDYYSPKNDT